MLLSEMSPQTALDLAEDERWLAIQRIVDSPHLRKSPRLSRLLLYLAEQTLLDLGVQFGQGWLLGRPAL